MNKDNNITNTIEYRENIMPDAYGVDINNPIQSNVEEFLSEEFVNAYLEATNQATPDLWSRIEAGFDEEASSVRKQIQLDKARSKKIIGFIAAVVVITIIALPVLMLGLGNSNSEKESMYIESSTKADMHYEEVADSVAMEAPAESEGSFSDEAIHESATEVENDTDGSSQITNNSVALDENGSVNQTASQLKDMEGVQTDKRQVVVVCELTFDEDADIVTLEIKEVKDNQYDDISIGSGYKITLSNPLFVQVMDVMLYEEEITLDSLEVDDMGNIWGRIIDIKHKW